jgi:TPP-dependent pyruvate/acetoin dehydrogenase alpha subunit
LGAGVDHPDRSVQLALYEQMLRSRRIEERTIELYRQGAITGGCYTGIGNEATSVGFALAIGTEAVFLPTQRDMGTHLVFGHTPLDVMLQYLKREGCQTGGKDSSLHLGREGARLIGHISPLAHNLPVACGVAFAERRLGRNSVVLATLGEGATSLGDFHESLNFAAVQKLPIVFVVVNNQYAYSTPRTIQYACERLSDRAIGYGMAGLQLDGTDALAVHAAGREAAARARRGGGPTLIESMTMRMRGHSEHDDFKYVPKELLDRWRAWDPLARMERHLAGIDLSPIREKVDREIERAIEDALAAPPPAPESAKEGTFRAWDPAWTVPASGDEWGSR